MKNRLLVGFITIVYLFFCSSGFAYLHVDTQEQAIHFTHQDGHSDEYHSNVPGKAAIKAFLARSQVKTNLFLPGTTLTPGNFPPEIFLTSPVQNGRHATLPVQHDRYLLHCSFLL